jgi:hypothetical protein
LIFCPLFVRGIWPHGAAGGGQDWVCAALEPMLQGAPR